MRILVTGDSHTEGFVNNEETFPNVLEGILNDHAAGGNRYEVINAGVGSTSPFNYLGVLRKSLQLRPDVFIAALFTGNDFTDDLRIHQYFEKIRSADTGSRYRERLRKVWREIDRLPERWGGAIIPNGFNSAYSFKHRPEEADAP